MNKLKYLKSYLPWLFIIFAIELFTALLLWLADIAVFKALIPLVLLMTIILFVSISYYLIRKEQQKAQVLKTFLLDPNKQTENELIANCNEMAKPLISDLANTIYHYQNQIEAANHRRIDYENYIETWLHEIKLPLSLLTLILDNYQTQLPHNLSYKLDYIRNQMHKNISQMMVYHRIKSVNKDYLFEEIDIKSCVSEVLEDYAPLLNEKSFDVITEAVSGIVFTDRRSLYFIIGQIISNTIKYSRRQPRLNIFTSDNHQYLTLHFQDNGQGVKACDQPHIFDKGFTGDSGDIRKTSTGLGLFLVQQLCRDLHIDVSVVTEWQQGFEIKLNFEMNK